jgi:TonB family protein
MFSAIFFKKFLPFVITFFCGAGLAAMFVGSPAPEILPVSDPTAASFGYGSGSGSGSRRCKKSFGYDGESSRVEFYSKPRAHYTDAARANDIQGDVTLRVTFLSSGEIGNISVVNGLPYGLTEQAIEAAKQIEFEPKKINGVPVTATMAVQYSFTIY